MVEPNGYFTVLSVFRAIPHGDAFRYASPNADAMAWVLERATNTDFAELLSKELWSKLGHEGTLAYAPWPGFDPAMAQHDTQEYVVQINGKVRHRFEGSTGLDASALLAAANADSAVIALLDGRAVVKEIVIPGRLVNFVVEISRKA